MYLTRPKSSKGRSRPAVKGSLCSSDLESIHRPPGSASTSRADIWQTRRSTDEHVFHLLQVAPAVAPHSLNKYNVLPSIVRQPEESSERILNKTMPKLDLSDDLSQTCSAQEDRRVGEHLRAGPEPSDTAPAGTRAAGSRRSLLLAVRAPCGRRFQQHFDPADTLLALTASAEVKYGTRYGDVSVETMDVPRRTFTDLNMTLEQCGILNRSVLCISHNDHVVEQSRDVL